MLITLDFETYYDNQYSLKKIPTVEYLKHDLFKTHGVGIKLDHSQTEWFSDDEIQPALQNAFPPNNKNTLLAHHTHFDGLILTYIYKLIPHYYTDTLSMSRGLFPGLPHNLGDLTARLQNDPTIKKGDALELTKGIRDLTPELNIILGDYCINDVDITYLNYIGMKDYLNKEEMDLINLIVRMYCEPHCYLDTDMVKKHKKELQIERQRIITESKITRNLLVEMGVEHNIDPTLSEYEFQQKLLGSTIAWPTFVEKLGVPLPLKLNIKGKTIPAFGKNDLPFQGIQREFPQFQHLWEARIATKSTSELSRCDRLLKATLDNDIFPIPLKFSGAANSHRLSGDEKINMQNLKRGSTLRRALKAETDYLIGTADSSQIEARVLCDLAGQEYVLEMFRQGIDTYSILASQIYGFEVNKKDHPLERFVGKTGRLGLGYQMGGPKFADTLRSGSMGPKVPIELKEANRIVYEVFRVENREIVKLWAIAQNEWLPHLLTGKDILVYGPLRIMKGRIILPNDMALEYANLQYSPNNQDEKPGEWSYYDGRKRVKIYGGKIIENVTQALARIIILYMGLDIDRWLLDRNAGWVIHSVHDETVSMILKTIEKEYEKAVIHIMKIPPDWMPNLPLDLEIAIGDRYEK